VLETVQDIVWAVEFATVVVAFAIAWIAWHVASRDVRRKRGASVTAADDERRPGAPTANSPERPAMSLLHNLFFSRSRCRRVARETGDFVCAGAVSEPERRFAERLGIAPERLVAERRLLLAGAVRSLFLHYEQRDRIAAVTATRKYLERDLELDFAARPGGAAELARAFATYGGGRRAQAALAFFRAVHDGAADPEQMMQQGDFVELFDEYAKDIEIFLRPRLTQLSRP